ncbi:MAG TPA: RNA-binding domain-containing protein [Allosphingosinicella sp.]
MPIDDDQINALIRRPSESLQVELKTWLDPSTDDGTAKLVKAIFAIRNRNGGFLVIGFNDETLSPDSLSLSGKVEELYHTDEIQGLVSRYANIPFEVEVALVEVGHQLHPVIAIPEGVRVPAVVKRDLLGDGGKRLLQEGEVYFRTLRANGTPSSARISTSDYPELLEICFENREADIGRFLRRQLAGLDASVLTGLLAQGAPTPVENLRSKAFAALNRSEEHFRHAVVRRRAEDQLNRVSTALTMSVAMVLEPPKPDALPTREFMNRVAGGNPQYSGWPVWIDTRPMNVEADRAYVSDGAWQALIADLDSGWFPTFEFLRYDPRGEFFLRRVMQDDLTEKVPPGTALDVVLMLYRVIEVLATGISIARAIGWEENDVAGFAFRWTGLNDRRLVSWVDAFRSAGGRGQSRTQTAESFIEVPLATPHLALAPHVRLAVAPLFASFDGFDPAASLIETCVRKVVERKMDH